jgi:hypothetical protein
MWLFAFTKYKLYAVPYELYQQGRFPMGEFLLVILSFAVAYLSLILTAYRVKVALEQQNNKEKNFLELND